jgi:O-antigen/teichoic acid export membrane protein
MSRLTRGVSLTLLTRLSLLLIGVASSVILARGLGPEGRGVYALIVLIPTLIQLLGGLGIEQAVTYLVARRRDEARGIALTLAGLSIALGVILIAIYALIDAIPAYQDFLAAASVDGRLVWILVALLPLTVTTVCLIAAILGLERYRPYNLATLVTPVVTLLLLAVLVLNGRLDVGAAVLAAAAGHAAGLVSALALVVATAPGPVRFISGIIAEALRYGLKVYGASVAWFLHYRSDMFLIGYMAGPAALGYYAIAVGLAEKLYVPPSAVGTVIFPRVAAGPEGSRHITTTACRHTFWLTLGLAVALALVAWPLVLLLFGADFLPAVAPLWLLLPGVVSLAVGRVVSSDLNGRGLPGVVGAANIVALAVNVGLNIWWIPIWGVAGAAAATSISYTLAVYLMGNRFARESGANWSELIVLTPADSGRMRRALASAFGRQPRQSAHKETGP